MKTVWVICKNIDMGYHMVKGYDSREQAVAECERLQTQAINEKVKILVDNFDYTQEEALDLAMVACVYDVESLEIEE